MRLSLCLALALALTPALAPGSAQALSCLPPNPARTLDEALRGGGEPRLMIGRLTTPFDNENASYRFEGRVIGRAITITRLASNVEVSASCVADWCGELPRRPVEGIFISDDPAGSFRLVFDPCGGGSWETPDEAGLGLLEACIAAGGCPAATVEAFDHR